MVKSKSKKSSNRAKKKMTNDKKPFAYHIYYNAIEENGVNLVVENYIIDFEKKYYDMFKKEFDKSIKDGTSDSFINVINGQISEKNNRYEEGKRKYNELSIIICIIKAAVDSGLIKNKFMEFGYERIKPIDSCVSLGFYSEAEIIYAKRNDVENCFVPYIEG